MPSNEKLEELFSIIEEGNRLQENSKFWEASERFLLACESLRSLASSAENGEDSCEEENKRISSLYDEQSKEYFVKAREPFLKALEEETSADSSKDSPFHLSMNEDEKDKRENLFRRLFGGYKDINVKGGETVEEKESSLAERLATLNANLPKGIKTADERMRDIDRGLNRLGIPVYSHADERPRFDLPKSEDAQLAEILAQAKDEARFEQAQTPTETNIGDEVEEVYSSDSGDSLSDDSFVDMGLVERKTVADLNSLLSQIEADGGMKEEQNLDHARTMKLLKLCQQCMQEAKNQKDDTIS